MSIYPSGHLIVPGIQDSTPMSRIRYQMGDHLAFRNLAKIPLQSHSAQSAPSPGMASAAKCTQSSLAQALNLRRCHQPCRVSEQKYYLDEVALMTFWLFPIISQKLLYRGWFGVTALRSATSCVVRVHRRWYHCCSWMGGLSRMFCTSCGLSKVAVPRYL
jgi:hypothetical protein